MKDDPVATCPECAGSVKRLLYPVGVVFKGSGWYINDSRKPEKTEAANNEESAKSTENKKDGETKSAASTPETSSKEPATSPS
jgi:predicted nucleic acid-binding Zn ribbon protein